MQFAAHIPQIYFCLIESGKTEIGKSKRCFWSVIVFLWFQISNIYRVSFKAIKSTL